MWKTYPASNWKGTPGRYAASLAPGRSLLTRCAATFQAFNQKSARTAAGLSQGHIGYGLPSLLKFEKCGDYMCNAKYCKVHECCWGYHSTTKEMLLLLLLFPADKNGEHFINDKNRIVTGTSLESRRQNWLCGPGHFCSLKIQRNKFTGFKTELCCQIRSVLNYKSKVVFCLVFTHALRPSNWPWATLTWYIST